LRIIYDRSVQIAARETVLTYSRSTIGCDILLVDQNFLQTLLVRVTPKFHIEYDRELVGGSLDLLRATPNWVVIVGRGGKYYGFMNGWILTAMYSNRKIFRIEAAREAGQGQDSDLKKQITTFTGRSNR